MYIGLMMIQLFTLGMLIIGITTVLKGMGYLQKDLKRLHARLDQLEKRLK